jgi:hypothetical protein
MVLVFVKVVLFFISIESERDKIKATKNRNKIWGNKMTNGKVIIK